MRMWVGLLAGFILMASSGSLVAEAIPSQAGPVAIVIHGGAGNLSRARITIEVERQYLQMLDTAVSAGHDVLTSGGTAQQAVIAAIRVMEDSDLFNAGKGAVLTAEGDAELDASIMHGRDLDAGAVAGVRGIRNPITLAEKVMTDSPHVMMIGDGAEKFAIEQGMSLVPNSYFKTPRRLEQLQRMRQRTQASASDPFGFEDHKLGTVGAVALDRHGDIVAGTSTGGMANKMFGRVGDAPVIGAGTYADNRYCGISATGHGEFFIRLAVAHDICARVAYQNISLQEAADVVIQERLVSLGADGGIIGLSASGDVVTAFNTTGMFRASVDREGHKNIGIFK